MAKQAKRHMGTSVKADNGVSNIQSHPAGILLGNTVMNPYMRVYTANVSLSQNAGTAINLITNAEAYGEVFFIAFYQVYHSNRSWGMWSGVFGGYGGFIQRMTPQPNDACILDTVAGSAGFRTLRIVNNNGFTTTGDAKITILVFGEQPVTLNTGSISG